MTREEAIKMVQAHKFPRPMEEWQRLNNEAIDMAIEALSADAEPKWNCTANFVAEQLERLREMTDEKKLEFFRKFFGMGKDGERREE